MGRCSVWDEDGRFSVDEWKDEVAEDNTRLGYWDWVEVQRTMSMEDDDA